MNEVTSKFAIPTAFAIAACVVSSCALQAQVEAPKAAVASSTSPGTTVTKSVAKAKAKPKVEMITPTQWLQRQPKPIYKTGHTLPRLTFYGYYRGISPTVIELTESWNYTLETMYLTDETVKRALTDPTSDEAKMIALTNSDPKKYPLAVVTSADQPPNPVPETFVRDAEGKLVNGNTYSPLYPQSTLDQMAELRARPLRALRKKVPINMVLNGGEYGLGVLGFSQKDFEKDPKVVAAKNKSGLDWFEFVSKARGREMDTTSAAVRKAIPDRSLYIYYATGSPDRNRYGGWKDWGMDPKDALKGSDLASTEYYYKHFNDGYLSGGNNDMLSRALNSMGFQIKYGNKYSYDWLSAGWENEADPNAAPAPTAAPTPTPNKPAAKASEERVLSNNNVAALVDPTVAQVSPMNLYTGFLKCLFTVGMLGGNAGYYEMPGGGFDGTFPADKPKNYLPQMTALTQVQALFSYLESDLRNSDLLPGPNKHAKSTDQPAFEFPTGDADARVLARKVKTQGKWIVTAWAADGISRPVKVTIPVLGTVTLLARASGSVYVVTLKGKKPQLLLTDPNAMTPTVKGFAPRLITEAQTLAAFPSPKAPQMQNLLVWFDAAKGVKKSGTNAVLSWKPQGLLPDWEVTSSRKGKEGVNASQPLPSWVADAGNGFPAVRFSGNQASLMSGKLKPIAELKEEAMTIFVVFAGTVPQETMSQTGANNSIFRFPSGSGISNGPWPDAAKKTWQMRMAAEGFKGVPEYFVVGGTFWSAQSIASDFFFSGDIAEMLVYRGDLPAAQKVQAQRYLNTKYKLGS